MTSAHTSEQTDNILTYAKVESLAVISGSEEDQVWVIVNRWINGAEKDMLNILHLLNLIQI